MPKNDDGEFELILANRQLLSVFFIVVILLGVFFTMGYIVGRNSAPLTSDASAVPKPDVRTPVPDTPARPIDTPPAETPSVETAVAEKPPVETLPQKSEPDPPKPQPVKAPPVREAREKPEKKEPKEKKTAPKAAAGGGRVVAGQMYLQLAATSQHEADIMVDVLRKKGFAAMDAEIEEKHGTFRVLVGPVTDNASTNKMRAELQDSGFPGNAAIRRTF